MIIGCLESSSIGAFCNRPPTRSSPSVSIGFNLYIELDFIGWGLVDFRQDISSEKLLFCTYRSISRSAYFNSLTVKGESLFSQFPFFSFILRLAAARRRFVRYRSIHATHFFRRYQDEKCSMIRSTGPDLSAITVATFCSFLTSGSSSLTFFETSGCFGHCCFSFHRKAGPCIHRGFLTSSSAVNPLEA